MATKVKTDSELVTYFNDEVGMSLSSPELDYSEDEDRVLTYERLAIILDDFSVDLDGVEMGEGIKISTYNSKPYLFYLYKFDLDGDSNEVEDKRVITEDFDLSFYSELVCLLRVDQSEASIFSLDIQTIVQVYGSSTMWKNDSSEYYAIYDYGNNGNSKTVTVTSSRSNTVIWVYWGTSDPSENSNPDTSINISSYSSTNGDYYESFTWPAYAYPWLYIKVVS